MVTPSWKLFDRVKDLCFLQDVADVVHGHHLEGKNETLHNLDAFVFAIRHLSDLRQYDYLDFVQREHEAKVVR